MNSGNSIVITGCCGTIGHALLRELAERGYSDVIGIDNNESGLFALEQEFRGKFLFRFGDLRDEYRMTELFQGADTVLHTAALKHVMPCEFSPAEAVKTNILGVANVITAARRNGVKRVLFTSSDKAANPTNVMGTTKLMGERLMTAAQASPTGHPAAQEPLFFSTRFGVSSARAISSSSTGSLTFGLRISPSKYLLDMEMVRLTRLPRILARSELMRSTTRSQVIVPSWANGISCRTK